MVRIKVIKKSQKWVQRLKSVWRKNIHGIKFVDSIKVFLRRDEHE